MASIAAAAPMAPRARAAHDGRASLFAEILEWRGDVALGCAPSIFRNNAAAHGPAFRSQLISDNEKKR
jgi:hypothetical protein